VTNPLFLAGVVIVAGFVGTRYWQPRSSLAYFVIQLAGFVTVTGLLLVAGRGVADRRFLACICCARPAAARVHYRLVTPKGGRCRRYAYRFAQKYKKLSLGVYPEVSL
jgi:hypothetical protein